MTNLPMTNETSPLRIMRKAGDIWSKDKTPENLEAYRLASIEYAESILIAWDDPRVDPATG